MAGQTIDNPDGSTLRFVGKVKTTAHVDESPKNIHTDSTTIEVIVSDGRLISMGSQWGHVAIDIGGYVYGMSHKGYDKRSRTNYLAANSYRDSLGVTLRVSPDEKDKFRHELERRIKIGGPYNLVANSCSTNVADVLESIGILAHDPRFIFAPASNAGVSPKELLIVIQRSKHAVRTNTYPKR